MPSPANSVLDSRRDPLWMYVALAAFTPVVLLVVQGQQLDGDAYHYIEYWHKLLAGTPHESSLHEAAPKAIPILLYGITYDLTHSFFALSLVSIALGSFAAGWLGRAAHALFGRTAARMSVLLVAIHPLYVRGMLEGSSALLELFFLGGALLVLLSRSARSPFGAGLLLLCAGLCRPDVWPLPYLSAPLLLLWPGPRTGRWKVGVAVAIAALAPALWMGFDALLTGDPLFSFRDTVDYGNRHLSGPAQEGVIGTALAYARRLTTTMVAEVRGPGLLLGGAGFALLLRRRPTAAVGLLAAAGSIAAFYFLPFRSGLPLLSRFLIVPISIANGLAGAGLARLVRASAPEPLEGALGRPRWGLFVALFLTALATLHSLDGLRRWGTGMGAFHARATQNITRAARWIATREDSTALRIVVPARRKGLAVIVSGLSSDAVTSFERLAPEDVRTLHEEYDYLLYQDDDLDDPYATLWEVLRRPPDGFQELSPPFDCAPVRIYVRSSGSVGRPPLGTDSR